MFRKELNHFLSDGWVDFGNVLDKKKCKFISQKVLKSRPWNESLFRSYNDVFNNYNSWLEKAKKQGKHAKKNFSFNKMTKKISEIFSENLKELPKKMELKLPGVDKIKMPKKSKLKIVK